jgi:hypothetical protein
MGAGTTVAIVAGAAAAVGLGVGGYFLLRRRSTPEPYPVPQPAQPYYRASPAATLGSATAVVGGKLASGMSLNDAALGLLNTYAPGSVQALTLAKAIPGAGKVASATAGAVKSIAKKLKFW